MSVEIQFVRFPWLETSFIQNDTVAFTDLNKWKTYIEAASSQSYNIFLPELLEINIR